MTALADGGGNNGNGAPIEAGATVPVIDSPQRRVKPKKPRKRKRSDEQLNGGSCSSAAVSGCTAADGDGKEKQEAERKARFVWTPKVHGKFVKACNELGVADVVPIKIMRRMKNNGVRVTRAQVASHLQKYRERLSSKPNDARMIVVHHTPLDAASPPPPTAPPQELPPSVPPPRQQQAPMEAPYICEPQLGHIQRLQTQPNGHSSNHVVAANLLHQQLHLLVVPLVQQCFAPPLHQIDAVTCEKLIMEEQPARMQQQGECSVPDAKMRHEESHTRIVQLQVGAKAEKGQGRAAEPEAALASLPGRIFEQYWGSNDREPSWDFSGLPKTD